MKNNDTFDGLHEISKLIFKHIEEIGDNEEMYFTEEGEKAVTEALKKIRRTKELSHALATVITVAKILDERKGKEAADILMGIATDHCIDLERKAREKGYVRKEPEQKNPTEAVSKLTRFRGEAMALPPNVSDKPKAPPPGSMKAGSIVRKLR